MILLMLRALDDFESALDDNEKRDIKREPNYEFIHSKIKPDLAFIIFCHFFNF